MSWFQRIGLAAAALVAATLACAAQSTPGPETVPGGHPPMMQGSSHAGPGRMGARHGAMHGPEDAGRQPTLPGRMGDRHGAMHGAEDAGRQPTLPGRMGDRHGAMRGAEDAGRQPTLPGQDAFGALQEVVGILEADPDTDWSNVDIGALREHLVDMNEVTLHAKADQKALADGVEIAVTGDGRTLQAIRRMVPAHAREIDGRDGWSVKTGDLPDGVRLTVTSADAKQARRIRALGFMGLMVQGAHHQPHHLQIARGELRHR